MGPCMLHSCPCPTVSAPQVSGGMAPVPWTGNLNASLDKDLEVQKGPSPSLFKGLRMEADQTDTQGGGEESRHRKKGPL